MDQAASASSEALPSVGKLLLTRKTRTRAPNGPDPSVLRPSIQVSFSGMKQAVKTLEEGTPEVRRYLLHECNLVYECRTCLNMFRSVANLIAHKRSFCRTKYSDVKHVYRRDQGDFAEGAVVTTAFVEPEEVDAIVPEKDWNLESYSPTLQLLQEAGLISEIENKPLFNSLRPPGLESVVKTLKMRLEASPEEAAIGHMDAVLRMERIKQTGQAVFQSYSFSGNPGSSMGQRYVELETLRQRPCVFVGPDGEVLEPGQLPARPMAKATASRSPVLSYKCPLCDKSFSKPMSISRHAISNHSATQEQARALRAKAVKLAKAAVNIIPFQKAVLTLYETKRCRLCSRSFSSADERRQHELRSCAGGARRPALVLPKLRLPPRRSSISPDSVNAGGLPSTTVIGSDQDSGISNNGNASEDSVDCSEAISRQAQALRRPEKRRRKALVPMKIAAATSPESTDCSEAKKARLDSDDLRLTNGDDNDDVDRSIEISTGNSSEPRNNFEITTEPEAGRSLELPAPSPTADSVCESSA